MLTTNSWCSALATALGRINFHATLQPVPGKFLAQVLGQSEQIYRLLKRSAEEISSSNNAIRHSFANCDSSSEIKKALKQIDAVAKRLQEATQRLSAVNQALQLEIRDRTTVDHQLAAAMEQAEGARHAALHDHLTGLPNRVLFKDRLEYGIAHAKRHRWTLAVMFVDLDNFKKINDTYGHQAGDAALQTVAERLVHNTRGDDTISRYGGDEFLCVLTPLHEENDISIITAKVLKAIQAPFDVRVGDAIVRLCLDVSIGISVFPKDGACAAALITSADNAMYGAKERKCGVAFAHEKVELSVSAVPRGR